MLLIKLIDKYIGNLLCNFLAFFKEKEGYIKSDSVPNRILVVQLWGIGETILTLPAIVALRKRFPKAEIDVLATSRNKDVFFNNKNINKIKIIELSIFSIINFVIGNIKSYDLVIDMEEYLNISAIISFFTGRKIIGYSHGSRSGLYTQKIKYNDGQHAVQTFLDLVRVLGTDFNTNKLFNNNKLPRLSYSKKDKIIVDKFLRKKDIRKDDLFICVAPGAGESAKARIWPYKFYAELCNEIIANYNFKVIFVGNQSETILMDWIQKLIEDKNKSIIASELTLTQLFYLMTKPKLFIGNDSGPMHIAAAQGVKTLGLFGPNIPLRFGPYGEGNIGLYKGYNCEFSPCINVHKGQVPDCLFPKRSNDYQKCMKNISVSDVMKEVNKLV